MRPASLCLGTAIPALLLGVHVGTAIGQERGGPPRDHPNILLMMADDLGWGDLSCYGNDRVGTPNIDRLAREGIRLTQFYAGSPVCTPTRLAVLTGMYPLRFDVRAVFHDDGEFLPLCETLPKRLKAAGYRTSHVGKWHLGGVRLADCDQRDRAPGPREHGFDHYLTQIEQQPLRGAMIKERTLYRRGGTCLLRDDQPVGSDDPYFNMYFTDILADEAIRQIRSAREDNRPFFLNLWWMTPHMPYEPAPEPQWSATAAEGISDNQHRFRSMVARLDFQVGRILDTLDELGLADETLVLFTSDNGGAWEANNGGLKAGKTDLHEGGIRVPFLARWPGQIPSGTELDAIGHAVDIVPTCCAAGGVDAPAGIDGRSLLGNLTLRAEVSHQGPYFWQLDLMKRLQRHEPKPEPFATEAVREGHWKLLALEGRPVELFDLVTDPQEQFNRLDQEPEVAAKLQRALAAWLAAPRRETGRVP